MGQNYEIDDLDKQIIRGLQEDGRKPYLELARDLKVSGGTIHQRVDRLKELGFILNTQVVLNEKRFGHTVSALLGIHLNQSKDLSIVINNLSLFDEVVEVYYTTGSFALIVKVTTKSIDDLHLFLINKLQKLKEIRSTESFICLDQPVKRQVII